MRVLEGSVRQSVTELVTGGDFVLVKVAVVNEETLGKVLLGNSNGGGVGELDPVVLAVLGNGERKASRGVDGSVENVGEGISRLLAGETSKENSGNVGVVNPLLEEDGSNGVDDNDGVLTGGGNGLDQVVTVVPESKVLAVTTVSVNINVSLTRVGRDESQTDGSLASGILDLGVGVVVKDGLDDLAELQGLGLDGLEGSNEVGEVGGSRSPSHSEGSVISSTVRVSVGSVGGLAGVGSEESNLLLLSSQGKDTRVLEKNVGLGGKLTDDLVMLATNVNLLVDETVVLLGVVAEVSVVIGGPGVHVGLGEVLVLVGEVVGGHDTGSHVVNSPDGKRSVENGHGHVSSKVGVSRVEGDISGHGHVKTGESRGNTRVLGRPVGHDQSLEVEFVLELLRVSQEIRY